MNILEKIIARKKEEVAKNRQDVPISELVQRQSFNRQPCSLKTALKTGNGIIAEYKRKSPSSGVLNSKSLETVLTFYKEEGVSGVSVLTDNVGFGGALTDLEQANTMNFAPVLRKDFIVDEYQIFEAKAHGADAILLIAEALDEYHARHLAVIAKILELEVLMEFHSAAELHKLNENVDIIGVNNRNLKTLKTDLRTAFDLVRQLPYDQFKIAESGISSAYEVRELLKAGYGGFLIGESILKDSTLLRDFNAVITEYKNMDYAS